MCFKSALNQFTRYVGCAIAGLVLSLIASPLQAEPFEGLQQVYHATFGNGSVKSGVDHLSLGELKAGHSQVPDTDPVWTVEEGGIRVAVTRPAVSITGPVSAGLFATPVAFPQGTIVGLRATFVAPSGPHDSTNQWAATLGLRTGGESDLTAETRTAASFQVRGTSARLNVVGAQTPPNLPFLPQEIYDAIFDPVNPEPFTLEIVLDRESGGGVVRLLVGESVFQTNFQSAVFRPNSGPVITAVGPSIAVANGPGRRASVRITDFRIFTTKVGNPNKLANPCPAELGCRKWP